MAEVTITDDNFDDEVLMSEVPVMVDFFAEWCGPCKMMSPIVEELAKEYEGKWKIAKCDVDANNETAEAYRIQSIPTIIFFKGGKAVDKVVGFQSKEALMEKLG